MDALAPLALWAVTHAPAAAAHELQQSAPRLTEAEAEEQAAKANLRLKGKELACSVIDWQSIVPVQAVLVQYSHQHGMSPVLRVRTGNARNVLDSAFVDV
ncbi:hypothetical protein O9K51_00486 [Purpureocillium lavendulum]|uniref:Uncharacterized protein n=1 Tax=Purpureocillium lavendulum TaxID=1247861 RepID=A0AB34G239_9HYPO|nr:hypothetical protein O9K51_00486 [Purpureocillium lavendulum]